MQLGAHETHQVRRRPAPARRPRTASRRVRLALRTPRPAARLQLPYGERAGLAELRGLGQALAVVVVRLHVVHLHLCARAAPGQTCPRRCSERLMCLAHAQARALRPCTRFPGGTPAPRAPRRAPSAARVCGRGRQRCPRLRSRAPGTARGWTHPCCRTTPPPRHRPPPHSAEPAVVALLLRLSRLCRRRRCSGGQQAGLTISFGNLRTCTEALHVHEEISATGAAPAA